MAGRRPRRASPRRRCAIGYPGKLATSVRGRLKRLATGANPAELQLGHDTSRRRLRDAPRASRRALVPGAAARRDARAWKSTCAAGGVQAAYFRVGGRTFDRAGPAGTADVPGRAAPADAGRADRLRPLQGRRRAELGLGAVVRGLRVARARWLLRRRGTRYRWFLDQLVVVRDDERVRVGLRHPRRAGRRTASSRCRSRSGPDSPARSRSARLSIGIRRRSAAARAHARRDRRRSRRSLIVPPRTFNPGRLLRSMDTGPERNFRLTQLCSAAAISSASPSKRRFESLTLAAH